MFEIKVVVLDLDNTLWDWLHVWDAGHTARMSAIEREFNVRTSDIIEEVRKVNQRAGTSEYTLMPYELPILAKIEPDERKRKEKIQRVQHAFFRACKHELSLYEDTYSTLEKLNEAQIKVVGFTDSVKYWAVKRIKQTNLDGTLSKLFVSEETVNPLNDSFDKNRTLDKDEYELTKTRIMTVTQSRRKPDPAIVKEIAHLESCRTSELIVVGDSLLKDVSMANSAGAKSAYAKYGDVRHEDSYEKLRQVSHWTNEDIERDRNLNPKSTMPDITLETSIAELLNHINLN